MKVFSTSQIRKADAYTIAHEPIESIDLMERASENCFNWIIDNIDYKNKSFVFFCGSGNNGGDGLAIARMLTEKKLNVCTYILNYTTSKSEDFKLNEKRLLDTKSAKLFYLNEADILPEFSENTVIIDAILGSGLSKPTEGFLANVIKHINTSSVFILSIDIPSGLFGDVNTENTGAIIKADVTLSLQFPKLSFFFPTHGYYAGNWVVIPIGLHKIFIEKEPCKLFFTLMEDIRLLIKRREKFAHKGVYGHALLMAGSYGKTGAAVLAAKACVRAGTGLLTVHVPGCGYSIMQIALPEAMVIPDKDSNFITENLFSEKYTAIGIGPGIDKEKKTADALTMILKECNRPIVFDADAINILAENMKIKKLIPANSIITPHIKEFERFAGEHFDDDYHRFEKQKELSAKHKIIIVLKGAYTCITTPEGNAYFNSTGNPGMATGGSGDVLTGIITGLLAQGLSPLDAACTGVFLHGLAGDIAVRELSEYALMASDIVEYLPKAFLMVNDRW